MTPEQIEHQREQVVATGQQLPMEQFLLYELTLQLAELNDTLRLIFGCMEMQTRWGDWELRERLGGMRRRQPALCARLMDNDRFCMKPATGVHKLLGIAVCKEHGG